MMTMEKVRIDLARAVLQRCDDLCILGDRRNEVAMEAFIGASVALAVVGKREMSEALAKWSYENLRVDGAQKLWTLVNRHTPERAPLRTMLMR